jgi:aquaporin Z
MKKYLAEAIGTAIFCLIGCGAIIIGAYPGDLPLGFLPIGLAFGLAITAMAFAIGPVSGCHINPAITVAMVVAGRLKAAEAPGYIAGQIVGALLGCALLAGLLTTRVGGYSIEAAGLGETTWNPAGGFFMSGAMIAEGVGAFILALVVLGATQKGHTLPPAGLVIGLTFAILTLVFFPVSGASFNPARSLATALIVGGDALGQVWLYLLAPTLGAVAAGLLFRFRLLSAE